MTLTSIAKSGLVLLATAFTAGCSVHYADPTRESAEAVAETTRFALEAEIRDIVYTEPGWPQSLQADLYLPQRRGLRPIVITIHGGGWAARGREDMDAIAVDLTERGYAVFNLGYRFAPTHTFPAQLDDMYQALAWLVTNAERYRLDPNRINAWGYSAGAHLAALLGSYDRESEAASIRELPPLRAVVAGGIPADLRKYDDSPIIQRFLGGTPSEVPEQYVDASPAVHISADDPPVFLYHGKLDFLVRLDQPEDYYAALVEAGVPAELYLQSFRGHGTMFLFGGSAEARAMEFLDRNNIDDLTTAGN